MILVIGGRWQGKRAFAQARFDLSDADIFTCSEDTEIDFDVRCVAYLDRWALGCVRRGEDPAAILAANLDRLSGAVVLLTDVSGGVVPVDAQLRAWREACGRMGQTLAARADEVWRLFCGLPQRLK